MVLPRVLSGTGHYLWSGGEGKVFGGGGVQGYFSVVRGVATNFVKTWVWSIILFRLISSSNCRMFAV